MHLSSVCHTSPAQRLCVEHTGGADVRYEAVGELDRLGWYAWALGAGTAGEDCPGVALTVRSHAARVCHPLSDSAGAQ